MSVWIATGGTGGHIFPALSIAKKLIDDGRKVIISTDVRGFDSVNKNKPKKAGVAYVWASGVGGKDMAAKLTSMLKISVSSALYFLRFGIFRPECVVSFGGYSTVPIVIAAHFLKIPILLHEQNAAIGRANKFILPKVNVLMTSFRDVIGIPKNINVKQVYTGLPVREDFFEFEKSPFAGTNKLFITGGSLGATVLDQIMPEVILKLQNKKLFITHQTRPENVKKLQKFYATNKIKANVLSFVNDMAGAIKDSDLIIGRSGASTIAELQTIGRGAILVPLGINPDQIANANSYSKSGAGIVIEQNNFTVKHVLFKIQELLDNPNRLKKMADLAYVKNNAVNLIVAEINKIIKN